MTSTISNETVKTPDSDEGEANDDKEHVPPNEFMGNSHPK